MVLPRWRSKGGAAMTVRRGDAMSPAPDGLGRSSHQRHLSDEVVDCVTAAVNHTYHVDLTGCDIGSAARGTSVEDIIDIDVLVLGVPNATAHGYHDWTDRNGL
jgi:hypothetical protein